MREQKKRVVKREPGDIITIYTKDLPPRLRIKLIKLRKIKKRSKFIKDAIIYWDFRSTDFKGYLREIIKLNFGLCKHLLRQIGRANAVTKE